MIPWLALRRNKNPDGPLPGRILRQPSNRIRGSIPALTEASRAVGHGQPQDQEAGPPQIRGAAQRVILACWMSAWALLILKCSDPLTSPEVQQARERVPAEQLAGFDSYIKHNCQACHGLEGAGNGPLNASGRFDMPDFTDPSSYRHGSTVSEIRNSIEFGVNGGRTGMQAYQNIPAEELEAIARHIRWLQNP